MDLRVHSATGQVINSQNSGSPEPESASSPTSLLVSRDNIPVDQRPLCGFEISAFSPVAGTPSVREKNEEQELTPDGSLSSGCSAVNGQEQELEGRYQALQLMFTTKDEVSSDLEQKGAPAQLEQLQQFITQVHNFTHTCPEASLEKVCGWCLQFNEYLPLPVEDENLKKQQDILQALLLGLGHLHKERETALLHLRKAADAGHGVAAFWAGLLLSDDDLESSVGYLRGAEQQGVQRAGHWLGLMLAIRTESWLESVLQKRQTHIRSEKATDGTSTDIVEEHLHLTKENSQLYEARALEAARYGQPALLTRVLNGLMFGDMGFDKDCARANLLLSQAIELGCPMAMFWKAQQMAELNNEESEREKNGRPCEALALMLKASRCMDELRLSRRPSPAEKLALGKDVRWPDEELLEECYQLACDSSFHMQARLMEAFKLGVLNKQKAALEQLSSADDKESLFWRAALMGCHFLPGTLEQARLLALTSAGMGWTPSKALVGWLWDQETDNPGANGFAYSCYEAALLPGQDTEKGVFSPWVYYPWAVHCIKQGRLVEAFDHLEGGLRHAGYHDAEEHFLMHVLLNTCYPPGVRLKGSIAGSYYSRMLHWRLALESPEASPGLLAEANQDLFTEEARLLSMVGSRVQPVVLPADCCQTGRGCFRALDLLFNQKVTLPKEVTQDMLLDGLCSLSEEECLMLRVDPGVHGVAATLCKSITSRLSQAQCMKYMRTLYWLTGEVIDATLAAEAMQDCTAYHEATAVLGRAYIEDRGRETGLKNGMTFRNLEMWKERWDIEDDTPPVSDAETSQESADENLKTLELLQIRVRAEAMKAGVWVDVPTDEPESELRARTWEMHLDEESGKEESQKALNVLLPLMGSVVCGCRMVPTKERSKDLTRDDWLVERYYYLLGMACHNLNRPSGAMAAFCLAAGRGYPLAFRYAGLYNLHTKNFSSALTDFEQSWESGQLDQAQVRWTHDNLFFNLWSVPWRDNFPLEEVFYEPMRRLADYIAKFGDGNGYGELARRLSRHLRLCANGQVSASPKQIRYAAEQAECMKNRAIAMKAPVVLEPLMLRINTPTHGYMVADPWQLVLALPHMTIPKADANDPALYPSLTEEISFSGFEAPRQTAVARHFANMRKKPRGSQRCLIEAMNTCNRGMAYQEQLPPSQQLTPGQTVLARTVGCLAGGGSAQELLALASQLQELDSEEKVTGCLLLAQAQVYGAYPGLMKLSWLTMHLEAACSRHYAAAWTCRGVLAWAQGHKQEALQYLDNGSKQTHQQAPDVLARHLGAMVHMQYGNRKLGCKYLKQAADAGYFPSVVLLRYLSGLPGSELAKDYPTIWANWRGREPVFDLVTLGGELSQKKDGSLRRKNHIANMLEYLSDDDVQILFYLLLFATQYDDLQQKLALNELIPRFCSLLQTQPQQTLLLMEHPGKAAVLNLLGNNHVLYSKISHSLSGRLDSSVVEPDKNDVPRFVKNVQPEKKDIRGSKKTRSRRKGRTHSMTQSNTRGGVQPAAEKDQTDNTKPELSLDTPGTQKRKNENIKKETSSSLAEDTVPSLGTDSDNNIEQHAQSKAEKGQTNFESPELPFNAEDEQKNNNQSMIGDTLPSPIDTVQTPESDQSADFVDAEQSLHTAETRQENSEKACEEISEPQSDGKSSQLPIEDNQIPNSDTRQLFDSTGIELSSGNFLDYFARLNAQSLEKDLSDDEEFSNSVAHIVQFCVANNDMGSAQCWLEQVENKDQVLCAALWIELEKDNPSKDTLNKLKSEISDFSVFQLKADNSFLQLVNVLANRHLFADLQGLSSDDVEQYCLERFRHEKNTIHPALLQRFLGLAFRKTTCVRLAIVQYCQNWIAGTRDVGELSGLLDYLTRYPMKGELSRQALILGHSICNISLSKGLWVLQRLKIQSSADQVLLQTMKRVCRAASERKKTDEYEAVESLEERVESCRANMEVGHSDMDEMMFLDEILGTWARRGSDRAVKLLDRLHQGVDILPQKYSNLPEITAPTLVRHQPEWQEVYDIVGEALEGGGLGVLDGQQLVQWQEILQASPPNLNDKKRQYTEEYLLALRIAKLAQGEKPTVKTIKPVNEVLKQLLNNGDFGLHLRWQKAAISKLCFWSVQCIVESVERDPSLQSRYKNTFERVLTLLWRDCGIDADTLAVWSKRFYQVSSRNKEPISAEESLRQAAGIRQRELTQLLETTVQEQEMEVLYDPVDSERLALEERRITARQNNLSGQRAMCRLSSELAKPLQEFDPELCENLLVRMNFHDSDISRQFTNLKVRVHYQSMRYYLMQYDSVSVSHHVQALLHYIQYDLSCLDREVRAGFLNTVDDAYKLALFIRDQQQPYAQTLLKAADLARNWSRLERLESLLQQLPIRIDDLESCRSQVQKAVYLYQYLDKEIHDLPHQNGLNERLHSHRSRIRDLSCDLSRALSQKVDSDKQAFLTAVKARMKVVSEDFAKDPLAADHVGLLQALACDEYSDGVEGVQVRPTNLKSCRCVVMLAAMLTAIQNNKPDCFDKYAEAYEKERSSFQFLPYMLNRAMTGLRGQYVRLKQTESTDMHSRLMRFEKLHTALWGRAGSREDVDLTATYKKPSVKKLSELPQTFSIR